MDRRQVQQKKSPTGLCDHDDYGVFDIRTGQAGPHGAACLLRLLQLLSGYIEYGQPCKNEKQLREEKSEWLLK
ncbi:MAG TPA: hypothetical protein VMB78_11380 [Dissulfurispiraceae bacterium]|nr:hypothetical protein [Dissulfurispiraceae bacterium]